MKTADVVTLFASRVQYSVMLAGVTFPSSEVGGKKIVWMQGAGIGEMASYCLLKKTISQLAADAALVPTLIL